MAFCNIAVFAEEQEQNKPNPVFRTFDSQDDRGWYFLNSVQGRWNPFGVYYQARVQYLEPLFREQNTFWFADSKIIAGLEQDIGPFSRTSAYLFFQPVIAFALEARVGYETAISNSLCPVKLDGPNDSYHHAYPPFTGLNPQNRKPEYIGRDALYIEVSPIMTFGGKAGKGMLALIYKPTMMYINAFGLDKDQYYYYGREAAVLKTSDILWRHDISLGYSLSGTGWSMAATTLIEQVQSSSRIMRIGVFGGFSYEKPIHQYPNLIPFIKGRMGTWVMDDDMKNRFAVQMSTGLNWKFN